MHAPHAPQHNIFVYRFEGQARPRFPHKLHAGKDSETLMARPNAGHQGTNHPEGCA